MRPVGTALQLDPLHAFPFVAAGTIDPARACSEVLMAYLRCVEFVRWGGTAANVSFKLEAVIPEWPNPDVEMVFPSASVVEQLDTQYAAHSTVPTALEGTWNKFEPNSVLWKTDEVVCEYQVDFWCNEDFSRAAILARLPSLFSPSEDRRGVMLSGDPRYFCRNVRATLLEQKRWDNSDDALQRERRCTAHIRCEIDDVHLRCATELSPRIVVAVREAGLPL